MTTGYVALYTVGGDGLGIASAATTVSLGNRNLDSGTGGLTGFYGVFGVGGTGAALAVGRAASTYAKAIIGGNLSTTTTNAHGLVIEPTMTWDGAATPVSTALQITPAYSGTFTLVYGAYLQSGSGGTIGTAYSLYCAAPSSGTTKYTAYFDGGVGIGAANATTNNFALRSTTVHLGDGFDGTAYGQLQITRPAANGTSFHQSFVRSGNAVFGLGYLSSSNTFGIQSGGDNTGSAGIFVDSAGSVGIGQRVPLQKLHVEGTVDGGVLGMCRNLSTGTGAYSGFFVQNSGASVCAWFMNSTTRTGDGPANSATLRNDAGALRLLSSGSVGITLAASTGLAAFGAGLTLPTSGGTASTFDYYEELSQTFTFTNVWAANRSVTGNLIRIGRNVTLVLQSTFAAATASNIAQQTGGTAIPARFRPAAHTSFIVRVLDNATYIAALMYVRSDGLCQFYASAAGNNFSGVGLAGWDQLSVSWNLM